MGVADMDIEKLSVETRFALRLYAQTVPEVERLHKENKVVEQSKNTEGKLMFHEDGTPVMVEYLKSFSPSQKLVYSAYLAATILLQKAPEAEVRELAELATSLKLFDQIQEIMPPDITNEEAAECLRQVEMSQYAAVKEALFTLGLRVIASIPPDPRFT